MVKEFHASVGAILKHGRVERHVCPDCIRHIQEDPEQDTLRRGENDCKNLFWEYNTEETKKITVGQCQCRSKDHRITED